MYHPLRRGERAIGLPGGTALALRQRLAAFVKANPGRRIAGKSLTAWLKLERGGGITMDAYARRQAQSGWGGSLELLAYMLSEKRDVWIWVPQRGGLFRRTTTFELPAGQAKDRVDLCYKGSTHYDWFQLSDHELIAAFQQRLNHGQQVFAPSLLAVALQ
jgi:hypothetical protein